MSGLYCYCGKEIVGRKRKYCSDECRNRLHSGNIGAFFEPGDAPDDDSLPVLPDDYVGAWLEPRELRKRNAELAKLGKRICRTHQGAALPLDEQHFYYARKEKTRFETECKACHCARASQYWHERATAPAFLEHRRAIDARSYQKHATTRRIRKRNQLRQSRQRKRREQFARILGGVA